MNDATRLEEILDRELDVARSLAATLESERKALVGAAAHAVTEIAARKAALLQELEKLETTRRSLCPRESTGDGADGNTLSRSMIGLGSAIGRRWQALMGLVAACRDANEANGLIVNLREGQVRKLLDIVRGPAVTYGPQGKTFARAMRPIARA
jgi:flagellar biosynthesis protein FlgN